MVGRTPARRLAPLALAASLGATATLAGTAPPARALAPPALGGLRAATLIAPFTGQRLYGVEPDAEVAIASTTKLMTALITLERTPLNATFTYPVYSLSAEDSQIGLAPGERMTVRDLLVAMLLPSADDAAYDLAYNIGRGSVARFVAMMNAQARALHLSRTHYSTPIGLDTPGNYSSADDLVKLAGYLLTNYPLCARVVAMPSAVLHSGDRVRTVTNLNDLVARVPWIHGVKTGHTLDAGYVLVAAAHRDGMTLLSAVLGADSQAARDADTLALLDWGFANYRLAQPVRAGEVVARPEVADRPGFHAEVIAGRSFSRVIPRAVRLRTRVQLPRQLAGPLARYARVGTLTVLERGRTVAHLPLLLARRLAAVSPVAIAARFLTRTSTLLAAVILLGGAVAFVQRRRGQRAAPSEPA